MKRLFLVALSLAMSCSLLRAGPRHHKSGAKITRNEAEHIALQGHSGARVTAARLEKTHGRLFWVVEVAGPNGAQPVPVPIDAMDGHILSARKDSR